MATVTIRISDDVKREILDLMQEEKEKHTPMSDAVTITETAFYDYTMKMGAKVIRSNRKAKK